MKIRDNVHENIVVIKKIDSVRNPDFPKNILMNEFSIGRSIDHPCFSRMFEIKTFNNHL